MAEISAAAVMKLRKMSGQGMMDCKKALEETNGSVEDAMTLLRKKGMATLAKRADRDTTEGKILCVTSEDGKTASMATLCCETDFAANSDDFAALADSLKGYMTACAADSGVENLLDTAIAGKKYSQILTDCVSKTGEKTELGDYIKYKLTSPGLISTYVHFNSKIGVMLEIETSTQAVADNAAFALIAKDICMHIAAINPLALDSSGIPADVIEKEKAFAADQMKDKPANMVEKIVEGKMKKYFAENCLLSQGFVKDDKVAVEKVLADSAKAAGGTAKIKRFVRLAIG
ncbi:MAG TPA: translation elongation factor Ts [Phycisphaerales bacterium]|nr:MAG: translation elongation factor Ts [Planctomycetes bacterium GWC2_45_44]HBG78298.1 translation elongation factor Ts [Phycisphaerales bacterium]HBR20806.1 translation elongation factor Ts [Phycisphaerales bacterium]